MEHQDGGAQVKTRNGVSERGERRLEPLKISIDEMCDEIQEAWSPVDLAKVNDQVVRMALFKGEYHWHRHEEEDELFYVYRGEITIAIKDNPDIHLGAGEITVVPKGVEHRPSSKGPSYVLMFEPSQLKSKGD
jgi:mannose-6-phosphate isomerase-like protein (cupin superfamily)